LAPRIEDHINDKLRSSSGVGPEIDSIIDQLAKASLEIIVADKRKKESFFWSTIYDI
jgi:hypothetical protein